MKNTNKHTFYLKIFKKSTFIIQIHKFNQMFIKY